MSGKHKGGKRGGSSSRFRARMWGIRSSRTRRGDLASRVERGRPTSRDLRGWRRPSWRETRGESREEEREIRENGAYSKESIMISQSSGVKEGAGKEEERL
jgi:hypothetical protein